MRNVPKLKTIYCDCDGVIADFGAMKNGVQRYQTETNFYNKIPPMKENIRDLVELSKSYDVYILTAIPKHQIADRLLWAWEHIPELRNKFLFVEDGNDKCKKMKPNSILIDDYTNNLIKVQKEGFIPIKFINERDNQNGGKHKQYNINSVKSLRDLKILIDNELI